MSEPSPQRSTFFCPETHQPLSALDKERLNALNEAVRDGTLRDHAGNTVQQIMDAGLLREDGAVVYPIRDGVPNLLLDDRIAIESNED